MKKVVIVVICRDFIEWKHWKQFNIISSEVIEFKPAYKPGLVFLSVQAIIIADMARYNPDFHLICEHVRRRLKAEIQ